ncbi:unnamed protein product [Lactuca saligna]|uniref:Uncharacterized protein n=1 Tax=Lactuca saligna TaxID=75948 RepID=A0AA35YUA0_LACSI|nr:unnamed protein product [Lactuca saligna]
MATVKNGFSVTGQRQTITLDWKTIIKRYEDFSGIGQAKSHYDVTKMFINSEIDEINDFKKELKANVNGGTLEKSITTLTSYASSYIDDFKGDFPLKTISEITEPLKTTQSVFLNEVPLESDDIVQNVQKDVISQTDESFTPSTVDKSSATSPLKISNYLTRNLHDIYDVDSGGDLSSTKSKRKSIGEGNTLLVPKVEK